MWWENRNIKMRSVISGSFLCWPATFIATDVSNAAIKKKKMNRNFRVFWSWPTSTILLRHMCCTKLDHSRFSPGKSSLFFYIYSKFQSKWVPLFSKANLYEFGTSHRVWVQDIFFNYSLSFLPPPHFYTEKSMYIKSHIYQVLK